MENERQQSQPSGVRYVDPFRDARALERLDTEERAILRTVNQKIAARPSLRAVVDYLFDVTQPLIPCDRIGLAFVDERSDRVTSYYNRASYDRLYIDKDYSEALEGSSLREVLRSGRPRIIDDVREYLKEHPRSRSTRLLVKEGVRSNLTCPLSVEGRVVGFIFRSSREPGTYTQRHIEIQMAITERLGQVVEKTWRIEQLEEANHAYMQMLGFVSHELKSPVASMVTDAQLLTEGYLGDLTPEQRAKVDGMARKGQYLLSLVREYLDLAQVEGGDLHANLHSRVDMARDIAAEAVELVGSQLEAHGTTLVNELPQADLPTVCCDPTLMRIVLVNLLDNAIKYGNEGGEVRLCGQVTPPRAHDPGKLRVSVWNEGPGFAPAQRNKLFRRFSRLDDPDLKRRHGTGVGLYNSWRIVQLHRGRMFAESEKGKWAKFWFEIPALRDCAEPTTDVRGRST
jgi:signal transduction histidine kinase